jgi:hypothetical protein
LEAKGKLVHRHRIELTDDSKPLLTDLYDADANVLIEAKGSVRRESVRMAVGQLLDYSRFLPEPELAILLPSLPSDDLLQFLHACRITVIYGTGEGFGELRPPKAARGCASAAVPEGDDQDVRASVVAASVSTESPSD